MLKQVKNAKSITNELQGLGDSYICQCFMCTLGRNRFAHSYKAKRGRPSKSENVEPEIQNIPIENTESNPKKPKAGRPKKNITPENMIRLDVSREDRVKNITSKITPRTRKLTLLELAKEEASNDDKTITGIIEFMLVI